MNRKKIINVTALETLAEHGIKNAVIAIGVFDGVHLGHRLLLDNLLSMGRELKAQPVALTFFPHPKEVICPDSAPPLLAPPGKKIELLHQYGVDAVVTLPFTKSFAAQTPAAFIRNCLCATRVKIAGICVGRHWRFGANGKGNVDTLAAYAEKHHFRFAGVEELEIDGVPVSSTAIRRAIAAGRLEQATAMLGRPYSLCGDVETGHQIAGTQLSHPTANLKIQYGILPPAGVYAAMASVENSLPHPAAVNIGTSPTFNRPEDATQRVEVHLINFTGSLYGKNMEVELLAYLREERCFPSPLALKQQIINDVEQITNLLKSK